MDTIAKLFLTGFTTTALLGPLVGNWVDKYGRKKGSMAFALFYTAAALAVCSNNLAVLFAGRVAGGIGTSLLFSAPEAWFVGEAGRGAFSGAFLGRTFGLAYFGDSIAAMTAGQVAQASANVAGPTAPFVASTLCLGLGALIASVCWAENKADRSSSEVSASNEGGEVAKSSGGGGIRRAAAAMAADPKILCVGAVQSLFEGAMYIFVLQWPNALRAVLSGSAAVPFGKVFSCFMASCMLGSSLFPALANRGVRVEDSAPLMLGLAATAMASAAAFGTTGLAALAGAFFAFEACVG
jgi:MFS family permease